jgi:hypothetical protein
MLEADHAESDEVKAQLRGIEHRVIAFDDARLFQLAHAPEAGRRRNAHALGQLDIGHSTVALQFPQDLQINCVQLGSHQGSTFHGMMIPISS